MKHIPLALCLLLTAIPVQADTLQEKKDKALALLAPLDEKTQALLQSSSAVGIKFPKTGRHLHKAAVELSKAVTQLRKDINALKEDQ